MHQRCESMPGSTANRACSISFRCLRPPTRQPNPLLTMATHVTRMQSNTRSWLLGMKSWMWEGSAAENGKRG